jgi:hypothetical protein
MEVNNMKYLEETNTGLCVLYESNYYILSSDFKSNGSRMCVNLLNGSNRWIDGNAMVKIIPLYRMDKENNIIPLRETKKDDANSY